MMKMVSCIRSMEQKKFFVIYIDTMKFIGNRQSGIPSNSQFAFIYVVRLIPFVSFSHFVLIFAFVIKTLRTSPLFDVLHFARVVERVGGETRGIDLRPGIWSHDIKDLISFTGYDSPFTTKTIET